MENNIKRETAFVAVLDLLEQYLELQHHLCQTLRTGFLNISAGRYSMGGDKVSSLQYPVHMHATRRVAVTEPGELQLVQSTSTQAASSKRGSATQELPVPLSSVAAATATQAQPVEARSTVGGDGTLDESNTTEAAATQQQATSSGSSTNVNPSGDGVSGGQGSIAPSISEAVAALHLSEDTSSFLQELAAKYHCLDADDAGTCASGVGAEDQSTSRPKKKPLQWFGALVAPQLREAERNFLEGK
ncbi:hypothetical protein N2152v2_009550 [Parachlorella kessleri]